jgi:uncharacterized membrane protein
MSVREDLPTGEVAAPPVPARTRVSVSLAAGIVVAAPPAAVTTWALWPMFAWDLAAVIYLTWVWRGIWRLDSHETARFSVPEDPTRAAAEFLILTASVVSLVAVGFVLGRAANSQGAEQTLLAALGVASLVLSWTVVHTVYTLRYARLYYSGPDGGVNFHGDEPPSYTDFAYLSFTIGMTFQVSDTDIESRAIRVRVLHQSLLSFLFCTGILATAVNLIANL